MSSQEQSGGSTSAPHNDEAPANTEIHQTPADLGTSPTVRFSSVKEEIEPLQEQESGPATHQFPGTLEANIQELQQSLQGTRLQNRRMSAFAFEPMSLPASRVPSNEENSHEASREQTHTSSGRPSPHASPRASTIHTPPLTPAASQSHEVAFGTTSKGAPLEKVDAEQDAQPDIPIDAAPISTRSSGNTISRPDSAGDSTRPTTLSAESSEAERHHGAFSIGPGTGDSVPVSRETSPSRSAYARQFTPAGDKNDPYAASKRPPQPKNLESIEPRFKFSGRRPKAGPTSSAAPLPKSSRSSTDMKNGDKKHSFLSAPKKDHLSHLHDESSSTIHSKGSMSELKRFLKLGGHHKAKRPASPTPSQKSGTRTPPHHKTPQQLPFGDDHGLQSRWGKFGKVLGAGAGGSVRLMKRSTDGTTFAVKEFRGRHSYETEKEYAKKVTAEFCVGSTLHHGNVIETLDIVQEKGKWYEVMEYAPFDLFAIVMTGKMSREEVTCSFLQILAGVTYLHSMGLAHRDLKLDNVVVNEFGIMKLIDFGSASMFRYPFENDIVLAGGIVGSDPYLAPEVYDERKYDPRPTDIWSLAIIFCCMSLRRFPWKLPRMTDNSYRLFAATPSPEQDLRRSSEPAKSTSDINATRERDVVPVVPVSTEKSDEEPPIEPVKRQTSLKVAPGSGPDGEFKKPEVIKGPWRLLRLLPRESRHIMAQMLLLDPKKRATMEEVMADEWVSTTVICRQDVEGNKVHRAPGHVHTLEPPSAAPTT